MLVLNSGDSTGAVLGLVIGPLCATIGVVVQTCRWQWRCRSCSSWTRCRHARYCAQQVHYWPSQCGKPRICHSCSSWTRLLTSIVGVYDRCHGLDSADTVQLAVAVLPTRPSSSMFSRREQWKCLSRCRLVARKFSPDVAYDSAWGCVMPTKGIHYQLFPVPRRCWVRDVVWWWIFSPDGAYDFVWDSVRPMTGNYFFDYFQYQEDAGCVCMLNFWFSRFDIICADNYIYFLVQVAGLCRSEKWELYLFGDETFMVDRDSVEVLPRGVPLFRFFTQLGNESHTIFGLCLPLSVAWV